MSVPTARLREGQRIAASGNAARRLPGAARLRAKGPCPVQALPCSMPFGLAMTGETVSPFAQAALRAGFPEGHGRLLRAILLHRRLSSPEETI